ncbi:hypothetical protein MTP99_001631 [Tenebrio molitor]|jgi:hypothetical protein|nr:hypothetical protein MTP99_001631 [Tenebrio molitor]
MQKTHEALKPLTWLIGRWVSINAAVAYPTMKPVTYCEEVTYESLGQPLLNYQSRSCHPDSGEPIHIERGFLRIKPGTNQVAFMIAHNLGAVSLEEGCVQDKEITFKSTSANIYSMSFVREPKVLGLERIITLKEDGTLETVLSMQTEKTPMTEHTYSILKKC